MYVRLAPRGVFLEGISTTMDRFINYLRDTKAELTHVSWPTQKQAVVYTALVIAVSIVVSLFLGLFDFLFAQALNWFIG